MIAVEKGHMEVMKVVVKVVLKEDPDLVSLPVGSELTVIHRALGKLTIACTIH